MSSSTLVFASENKDSAKKLTDGNQKTNPMNFNDPNVQWAVFDLGNGYQLSKVVLYNAKYRSNDPISFYIGSEFQLCKFHNQIKQYNLCQQNVIQNDTSITINCQGSNSIGRYLAMVKGLLDTKQSLQKMSINEVEAFGTLIPGQTFPSRPIINMETLPPLPDDAFIIAKTILNGVNTVTIPAYSNSLIFFNKNCQSIIWDPSSLDVFSVGCKSIDGKGRLTVFGKESFLSDLISNSKSQTLKANLFKWLSPNTANPNVVLTKSITILSDLKTKVKTGDILDFYTWKAYPNEVLDEIINMCLNGTIAISLDHTFWVSTTPDVSKAFMKILYAFNVEPTSTYMTWSSTKDFTYSADNFNEEILPYPYILERMAINHDYFLTRGERIAKKIGQMSSNLIINSTIGEVLRKLINKYDSLLNWICPCKLAPAIDTTDRKIINIYSQLMMIQGLANSSYKLPCIDLFPGDFEKSQETKTVTVTITGQTDNTNNPIGYSLEAGKTLTYECQKSVGIWSIRVGCHTDTLDDRRTEWYRYPTISLSQPLNQKGVIYSPFGGVLWLTNSKTNDSITITLTNVIPSPFFNGRDNSSIDDWKNQVETPGLWAQIQGESISFCEKSSNVKALKGDYLMDLMRNCWDKIVRMDYALTGVDWKVQRPQIVVLDIMLSIGYGHSGYPIVVWDDWTSGIFNKTNIFTEGSWGMCHEIGHNLQNSKWTYVGLGEVTNNALCLFNYDKLWNVPRYGVNSTILRGAQNNIIKYLNNGAKFDDYKNDPWLELGIYSQMAENLGWGFFKDAFQYYIDNKLNPSTDVDKIATWITTACTVSGQNLLPLFDFWGVPIAEQIISKVKNLPCFMSNDFFGNFSSSRFDFIQGKYPNCNTKSIYFKDYDPAVDVAGTLPNYLSIS